MPKLAIYKTLVFFLYAYDLSERMHVHVSNTKSRKGKSAKIWLDTLEVFEQGSLTSKEINTEVKLLEKYGPQIAKRITEFATEGKINVLHLS
ncbi:DUF4160 domain-containing protein [Larkinella punicea]|uniref:DUF4160 domain-containing protein n=1 Tax=Larkinella punicea TaxID=2315727 RepID=A0A368JM87_9BACT|nr:DUF4160 domain-containing protein [Larkinella punicea]RCR68778.1 DUF4160 domain-containing protein [Larkinella punicea]